MAEPPMLELPDEIDLRSVSSQRTWDPKIPGGVYEHIRERAPAEITGIVLHQTACYMGERPERYLHTGAHRIVTRGGQRLWLHDATARIVAANGFNARCVSIEGDGIYAGDDSTEALSFSTTWDDPTTAVRERPMSVTAPLVGAYRETIRSIVREVAAAGGRVKFLFAHRQSSESRRNDPGRQIWQAVAMPMIAELGLNVAEHDYNPHTFRIVDGAGGRPIPESWDPACVGNRY